MPRTELANKQVRDSRREEILNASAAVFGTKGIASTKICDLATEAGISQGLLYRYFADKEQVYVELLNRAIQAAIQRVETTLGTSRSPWQKFTSITEQFLKGMVEEPVYYRVFSQALAVSGRVGQALEKLEALVDSLREIVAAGQAAGEIADGDPEQLVLLYLACLYGLAAGIALPARSLTSHLPDAEAVLRILKK